MKKKPVEEVRRGHPAMKYNKEIAEQFGIVPGPDPPRELVQVQSIPVPPDVEQATARGHAVSDQVPEDSIANVLREEAQELSSRLERYGVAFPPQAQQQLVDYAMAILSGYVGGGAIARRQ
jgi:hypothetical protein